MTNYKILVDGQETGFTIMSNSAKSAAEEAYEGYWMSHLGSFKKYGGLGVITAKGPIRFPDGYQEVSHF